MEPLKDYFEKSRCSFDDKELTSGHEQRFLNKLEKKKSKLGLKIWYGVAASLILLTMLSFFAKDFIFNKKFVKNNSAIMSLSDISFKYQEVEEFYQAGINEKIIEFKHLECKVDNDQLQQIDNELAQFDQNYLNLQVELKKNVNDERIINAMINNYQTKITFLELVIDQIKQNC
jgi:hypothetical protein